MTLRDACDAYLQELQAQKREQSTYRSYDYLFRAWQIYAVEHGLTEAEQLRSVRNPALA